MQHTTTSIQKKIMYQLFQQLTRYFFFLTHFEIWSSSSIKFKVMFDFNKVYSLFIGECGPLEEHGSRCLSFNIGWEFV